MAEEKKETDKITICLKGKRAKKFLVVKGKLLQRDGKNYSNPKIVEMLADGKC